MTQFHPDENILTEYVAGTLEEGVAMAVKAHLHFCSQCQKRTRNLSELGGQMLVQAEPADVDNTMLDTLMERIDSLPDPQQVSMNDGPVSQLYSDCVDVDIDTSVPNFLRKLVPDSTKLAWRKISRSMEFAQLSSGQNQYRVALYKIFAGGKSYEHDHGGDEYTVILKGSFSDEQGVYREGDFIFKRAGQIHRPVAAINEDCLCFTVEEAPVKITGILGWLLNPFLKLTPA